MGIRQEQELDPGLLDFLAATDSDKVENLGGLSDGFRTATALSLLSCIPKLHVETFVTPNQNMAKEAGNRSWNMASSYFQHRGRVFIYLYPSGRV